MKKIFKVVLKIFVAMIVIIIILLVISYINHKIKLSNEDAIFSKSIGTKVEVNGHLMNVYTEGNGEKTLVFLSGGGTSSPVLDFKSLYSKLSDEYKIVVVEKAGYGFSEISDNAPRDIETILAETRQALLLSEIEAPYVLCPHSMSGIEALYWAQKYPDEIESIIGLDMSVPQMYADMEINLSMAKMISFAANIGVTRWIPSITESDALKYGTLSEEDKKLYRAVFYRRTQTSDMLNEVAKIKSNAKIVEQNGIPDIPILIFSSNGTGTGFEAKEWVSYYTNFIKMNPKAKLIQLNVSHYVHDIEYEKIAEEIRLYLQKLDE